MSSTKGADGRWSHVLRQSFLKEFDICPQKAMRSYMGLDPQRDTDAACVGTAVHAAIEACMHEHMADGALLLSDTLEVFNMEFSHLMGGEHFVWVKYSETQARAFGEKCITSWYEDVLPTLDGKYEMEWSFHVPLYSTEDRDVFLSGTADLLDLSKDTPHVIDWKTSGGGPYREWEHKRWAIQPTVYTFAASYETGITDDPTFEYVVMHPKGVQRLPVVRTPAHWDWLAQKCEAVAKVIEAELDEWPKNDSHALCAPTWCSHWSECKGASLGPDPWQQL